MKIFLAIFYLLLAAPSVSAQVEVTGTVLSSNNRPIGGVNVMVKGTANGTATGMNGNFKIYLPEGRSVLFFSFLKQKALEHPVDARRGYRYEIYVTLSHRTQTFHKSQAVTGELPVDARALTGRVFDQNDATLGGVSVVIEDAVFKRRTDVNGYFRIPLPAEDSNLTFSLPGYKTLSVRVSAGEKDQSSLKVLLVEDRSKYRKLKSFATSVPADVPGTDRK